MNLKLGEFWLANKFPDYRVGFLYVVEFDLAFEFYRSQCPAAKRLLKKGEGLSEWLITGG